MMKNVIFKINNKNLYEDQILLDYIYPVLFTCVDDHEDMYLSVCYDANVTKTCWLLAKVDPIQVIKLLKNDVTIRELFESDNLWNICRTANNSENYVERIKDYRSFDPKAFPAAGEYMDADEDEFLEEIELFKKRIPLSKYQIRQEECFVHLSNIININLKKIPVLPNIVTYKFQEDNQEKQLCGIDLISGYINLKNAKYKGNDLDEDTVYHYINHNSIREYNNVYIS